MKEWFPFAVVAIEPRLTGSQSSANGPRDLYLRGYFANSPSTIDGAAQ